MPFLPVTELKVTIRARFPYKNRNTFHLHFTFPKKEKKRKCMNEFVDNTNNNQFVE